MPRSAIKYDSAQGKLNVERILEYMRTHNKHGVTQLDLCVLMDMKRPTISGYVMHLERELLIHVAVKMVPANRNPGSSRPAIYKIGPDPTPVNPPRRPKVYSDLPLNFFRSSK